MSKDTERKSEKIMDMESKVLWYPDSKRNTQMDKFRIQVNGDYGLNLGEQRGGREGDRQRARLRESRRVGMNTRIRQSWISELKRNTEIDSVCQYVLCRCLTSILLPPNYHYLPPRCSATHQPNLRACVGQF